jgi:AraC-like DNA-binding protein
MFTVSGNIVHNGEILPGMSHVSGPEDSVQASFRAPCDFIHLFIAKNFITQCFEECDISETPGTPSFRTRFVKDAIIEQLIRSLSLPKPPGPAMGQLYIEGVCLAIVARLISEKYDSCQNLEKPKISALANWRLKRALEYIETKISEPITLADVAASTGLTRMYFAAQFRAATGLRPHEYILRRRIERAQNMLLTSNITLIDAAFSVGFQTQAHFTTVFKKVVGETPYRWREANLQRSTGPKLFPHPKNDGIGKPISEFKGNGGSQTLPRLRSNGFEYANG